MYGQGGHPAQWQPPRGVSPGVWQYTRARYIAQLYDHYFAANHLFQFDQQVLARHFARPGLVIDLGCGTARALIPLVRRGFQGLAVDLSLPMLRIVGQKARLEHLPIHRLLANLVELDCIRSNSADYCICLFSTLGMIRGRQNRHRMLAHTRRILKPGGLLVIHAHNLWYNLFDPAGRRWLATHLPLCLFRSDVERGDKFFHYRGIPEMFVHTFTQRELLRALRRARFRCKELIPLDTTRQRLLKHPRLLGRFRANGWIAVCQ